MGTGITFTNPLGPSISLLQWKYGVVSYLRADLKSGAQLQAHVVEQVLLGQQRKCLSINGLLSEHL